MILLLLGCVHFAHGRAAAQEAPSGVRPSQAATLQHKPAAHRVPATHAFWDRPNVELFAGVGTVRALDFASTRHFRARGVNEVFLSNDIVDNKPLLAGIEAAAAAASIGISYLLHKKGHHKLERWISMVHISVGGVGDVSNYTLGSSRPSP